MTYDTEVKWDLWYHSITDNNWGKSSYKKLSTLTNLLQIFRRKFSPRSFSKWYVFLYERKYLSKLGRSR
jgi:hypothetical protein